MKLALTQNSTLRIALGILLFDRREFIIRLGTSVNLVPISKSCFSHNFVCCPFSLNTNFT